MAKNPPIVDSADADTTQDAPGADEAGAQDTGAMTPGRVDPMPQDDSPNVTPEQQKDYDIVSAACLKMIFGQNFPDVVKKLQGGQQQLSTEIGHTAAMLLRSAAGTAKQSGKQIDTDVLFGVGQEIVGELVDISIGAKIAAPGQRDDLYQAAVYEALRTYGKAMRDAGEITPDSQKDANAQLDAIGVPRNTPPGSGAAGMVGAGVTPSPTDNGAAQGSAPAGQQGAAPAAPAGIPQGAGPSGGIVNNAIGANT